MAGGRPTKKNADMMERICEQIGETTLSLVKICQGEGMPNYRSVMRWLANDEEFRHNYARAREAQADLLADECIEIADDKSQDILDIPDGGDTRLITNSAAVQRAKVQIDARKWKAGQMAPKKWGQQNTKTELVGEGGGAVKFVVEVAKAKE